MILFIVIAIAFFIYTIFAKEFLIDSIKNLDEYNKDIEEKIRRGCTNYDLFFIRKYDKRDYESIPKIVFEWLFCNVFFQFCKCNNRIYHIRNSCICLSENGNALFI